MASTRRVLVGLDAFGIGMLIAGAALFLFEIAHPGAFLLVPGTVLLVGGVMYLLLPNFLLNSPFGPLVIVVAALISALVSIPIYRRLAPVHRPLVSIPTSLEGRVGIVTADVLPDSMAGKVQVDAEIWSARADQQIPAGTRVRIIGGQGVCVVVRPLDRDAPPASGG